MTSKTAGQSPVDLLFIRPADDNAAALIATWGQALRLMVSGQSPDDLYNGRVTRAAVELQLSRGVRSVFWFGHGIDAALIAESRPIIDVDNLGFLKGGMVVAIACFAGGSLGRNASKLNNVAAFLGFDDELGVPAAWPMPMGAAVVEGLRCLFEQNHGLSCAVRQLRAGFDRARIAYRDEGTRQGMTFSEARLGRLFAKSNRYSVQLFGRNKAVRIRTSSN